MNALILQCGGPTAVLNTSLAAAVQGWQSVRATGHIYGSRLGMKGLVAGDWTDLTDLSSAVLAQVAEQPGAALGSSRYRPTDAEFPRILEHIRRRAVGVVFFIGGNGTMAAAERLEQLARTAGYALQVIGIPKTVDNDLAGTEVTPGYGSAARFIATTTLEAGLDLRAMRGFEDVVVYEVMGRYAGWLAASAALARSRPGDPPHIVLLPERPLAVDALLATIAAVHRQEGICFVVTAEGARDDRGHYLAELLGSAGRDASGQVILSLSAGVAAFVADQVHRQLGLRCRQLRPNTLQRVSAALASPVDRYLAHQAGAAAVQAWADGLSGVMVSLARGEGAWQATTVPFSEVVGRERHLPDSFIGSAAFDVGSAFIDYARALVGPLPPTPVLFT